MLPEQLTEDYIKSTCGMGKGEEACSFLAMGAGGFTCVKHQYPLRWGIDKRREEGTMRAKGDNCEGVFQPPKQFRLKAEAHGHPAGTIVYDFVHYDYGLASDDTRGFGHPHVSVTLDQAGGYPSFTVAERDLEPA